MSESKEASPGDAALAAARESLALSRRSLAISVLGMLFAAIAAVSVWVPDGMRTALFQEFLNSAHIGPADRLNGTSPGGLNSTAPSGLNGTSPGGHVRAKSGGAGAAGPGGGPPVSSPHP